jgi:histidinol-phosphate aminotransferase
MNAATSAAVLRLRDDLARLPAYAPGKPVDDEGQAGKLSANESPFGPLPTVLESLATATTTINRYPDPAGSAITQAIAERHRVEPEQVAVGPGSVALLQQLVRIAAGPGDEVLYAWRSFEAYPIVTLLAGATPRTVPLLDDGTHNLAAIAHAVGPKTRLIFLCTPNNPTGRTIPHRELEQALDAIPHDIVVAIDEAYREYVQDSDATDALSLLPGRPNVCVLRTFSKAYGLAGLRIGYAITTPTIATALRKTTPPFAVTDLAQSAALASLRIEPELLDRVAVVVQERERLYRALLDQDWRVIPSEANFLWIADDGRADGLVAACARAGLQVRPFPEEGVRVTVGTREVNDRLVHACASAATRKP